MIWVEVVLVWLDCVEVCVLFLCEGVIVGDVIQVVVIEGSVQCLVVVVYGLLVIVMQVLYDGDWVELLCFLLVDFKDNCCWCVGVGC